MGDRSMEACLIEQLEVLRRAQQISDDVGPTLQGWYDDGADVKVLLGANTYDVAKAYDVTYAWGYLEGVADAHDLTVMEMLDEHGLTFDAPPECLIAMGCLCAFHARGGAANQSCDTTEIAAPRRAPAHKRQRIRRVR